jgi:PAS domain S-box-containing protein
MEGDTLQYMSLSPSTAADFESYQSLLSAIVDSSDDAIVSKNLDGIITSWNKGAQRIFGYEAHEVIGKPVMMLIPADRQSEEQEILSRLRSGRRMDHFETIRLRKDGSSLEVSLTISPVKTSDGRIIGASKIVRDISQRRQAEAQARAATEELQKQSRIKDEFIATLSHELRTPLQSILGWVQLLRYEDPTAAEVTEGLEVIERNVLAQGRIVEDLLEMNRLMSGKIRLEMEPIDLGRVTEEAVESVMPSAQTKEITIRKILAVPVPSVTGDAGRIQQVLWNLLTNAIKFTPRKGEITVHLARVDSQLEITVTDNGIGISADFLPYVFDRFRQADGSSTRQHGGLGLGLAIVKSLVELHGGTVAVDSPGPGKGSSFMISLPVAAVSSKAMDAVHENHSPALPASILSDALKQVEVLVVDDDADARTLIGRILGKAGATIVQAGSGADALTILEHSRPQLIICDIGMPGMDGHAFIRTVRAHSDPCVARIPALALTAYSRTEDRMKAITAGFQMHIGKPVGSAELLLLASTLVTWRV